MNQQLENSKPELTAEQVCEYLQGNPEFFNQHPELLESIKLSDQKGGVVSLTMRQLALLREKNEKSQQQLAGLLDIARENDALFCNMQQLTAALLDARCVEDVFATLDDLLRDCFSADFFALRLLANDTLLDFPISDVVWQQDSPELDSFKRFFEAKKIKCGHPTHAQAEALFYQQAEDVKSVAFIPLTIGERNGMLAIGSKNADRFHPAMGDLFLAHLGEMVGKRLASLQDTGVR